MTNHGVVLRTERLQASYVLHAFGRQVVVKAVDGVDVSITKGEVFGIAGESGCGKSTLIKALFANIEPPLQHIGGRVLYQADGAGVGVDVLSLRPKDRRRFLWKFISYVPQGSMSILNPVRKVKATFQDFLASHVGGQRAKEALEITDRHLSELGLPLKVLDYYPHQLSGGMRQRVTIALATLLQPEVILADEPTTALDVVVQRGAIQLLKEIQQRWGSALVLVTHDMGVQANIADRIAIMYAGKVVEEADTQEIFRNPQHPYTRFLIRSLPRFGDRAAKESAPGSPPSLANLPGGCAFHPRCPHAFDACRERVPELVELEGNRRVACWLIGGEGGEAP